MRVHQLAKELGISNKDLMSRLAELGVTTSSHMNAVPEEILPRVREELQTPADIKPSTPEPQNETIIEKKPEQNKTKPAIATEKPPEPTVKPEIKPEPTEAKDKPQETISIRGAIIVKDLAEQMGMKPNQLITELMHMNVLASINERIDVKTAQHLAEKHGFILDHEKKTVEPKPPEKSQEDEEDEKELPADLETRCPVVAFLGHIDHGKTSLLDKIRKASVAENEAGGITQHIGAYTITHNGQGITFLDTPGHAAFTAMRARGANLTDIAIVVIAADDGIMPQTREAIKHVQAAKTSIIVAINKIDLPGANPDKVMQQLQAIDLAPEEWGGNIICCKVSATTGEGIDNLIEMILLQAEILELRANPKTKAQGYIIEAQMEQGVGPTAHLLVSRGTLHVGDAVVCGPYWGRVKALTNDHGIKVRTAGPATPIKCMGLSGVPLAGEEFKVYRNDKLARVTAESRKETLRAEKVTSPKKASLDELFNRMNTEKNLELRMVLKCDTQGSLEAIQNALSEIVSSKISISIILGGIGNVTANDVLLASASNAIIVGFNISKEPGVPALEKREGVEVRLYAIIYDILDEMRKAMTGMLAPELREKPVGKAEVRQIFDISKKGRIAGCMVIDGVAAGRCKARVLRKGNVIYEGSIMTLKRFQNDTGEVREGMECGIRLDNFSTFEQGDIVEFYEIEEIAQNL